MQAQHILRCDIDPSNPVQEINAVIAAVIQCNPGKGPEILNGIAAMIEQSRKVVNQQNV
jgi:hypothetical protein